MTDPHYVLWTHDAARVVMLADSSEIIPGFTRLENFVTDETGAIRRLYSMAHTLGYSPSLYISSSVLKYFPDKNFDPANN